MSEHLDTSRAHTENAPRRTGRTDPSPVLQPRHLLASLSTHSPGFGPAGAGGRFVMMMTTSMMAARDNAGIHVAAL
ncbi:unnamed protein product [Menidia menidia]|uniref:(Atlantic silverside) hypothetical protein n=1 Tax=Menidia menidia TaxID=238744 RepID=A0A8S4BG11_9TELE|nr:unnamed protein product [Menidia menidia]